MNFREAVDELAKKSAWREQRMDTILDAYRLSNREHSYQEIRDMLLAKRGLGKITD